MENRNLSERTTLKLLGIEKQWVYHDGQWTDLESLNLPIQSTEDSEDEMDLNEGRKWWQFWKK